MHKRDDFHSEENSTIYSLGMGHWSENLKRELRERGWGVPDLARAMGKQDDHALLDRLHKYVQGRVDQPRGRAMAEIAEALGTTAEDLRAGRMNNPQPMLIGEVAAGRYVEFLNDVRIDFEPKPSEFPAVPGYPISAQFDLRVSGSSINRLASEGDFLRCVSMLHHPVEIRNDDFVIFERLRGQLREVTAKRIRITADRTELWPYSTDPQWQTPVILPYGEHEGEEGRIIALVVYVYRPARGR